MTYTWKTQNVIPKSKAWALLLNGSSSKNIVAIFNLPQSALGPHIIYTCSTCKIHSLFSKESPSQIISYYNIGCQESPCQNQIQVWMCLLTCESLSTATWIQFFVVVVLKACELQKQTVYIISPHIRYSMVKKVSYNHSRHCHLKGGERVHGNQLSTAILKPSQAQIINSLFSGVKNISWLGLCIASWKWLLL